MVAEIAVVDLVYVLAQRAGHITYSLGDDLRADTIFPDATRMAAARWLFAGLPITEPRCGVGLCWFAATADRVHPTTVACAPWARTLTAARRFDQASSRVHD